MNLRMNIRAIWRLFFLQANPGMSPQELRRRQAIVDRAEKAIARHDGFDIDAFMRDWYASATLPRVGRNG